MFVVNILLSVKLKPAAIVDPDALFSVLPVDTTVSVTPDSVTNVHSNPSASPVGIVSVVEAVNITIPPLSAFVSVYGTAVSTTSLLFTYSLVTTALPVVSASIKALVVNGAFTKPFSMVEVIESFPKVAVLLPALTALYPITI